MNKQYDVKVDPETISDTDLAYVKLIRLAIATLLIIAIAAGAYALGYNIGTKNVNEIEDIPVTTVTETEIEETVPITTVETVSEAVEAPVTTETVSEVSTDELEMLACVIYQEAGADYICDDCRRRVADVVLNRVEHEAFPDTMHEVLTAPGQYGKFCRTGVVWDKKANHESEAHAVARAYRIAEEVLSGQHSELYGNGYIWQAEFRQGSEQVKHCGIYFGR